MRRKQSFTIKEKKMGKKTEVSMHKENVLTIKKEPKPDVYQQHCFVCDDKNEENTVSLLMSSTPYSNTSLPTKIGQLIGDEFMVIVSADDVICNRCSVLINHYDKLEFDMETVKTALLGFLMLKYKLQNMPRNIPDICNLLATQLATKSQDILTNCIEDPFICEFGSEEQGLSYLKEVENNPDISNVKVKLELIEESEGFFKSVSDYSPLHQNSDSRGGKWVENVGRNSEHRVKGETSMVEYEGTNEKYHQCKVCNFKTLTAETLMIHSKLHSTGSTYTCAACLEEFESESQAQQHVSNGYCPNVASGDEKEPFLQQMVSVDKPQNFEEEVNTIYNCIICEYGCDNKALFDKHISGHSDLQHMECSICFKQFKIKKYLEHMKTHMPKTYKCGICGETYHLKVDLIKHFEVHKDSNNVPSMVEKVENKMMEDKVELSMEIDLGLPQAYQDMEEMLKKLHGNELPQGVGRSMGTLDDTGMELIVEDMNQDSTNLTDNKLNNDEYLQDILDMTHVDPTVKTGRDGDMMTVEVVEEEGKVKEVFVCSTCGLRTSCVTHLRRHFRSHLAIRRKTYQCRICNKLLTTHSNLKRHMENHQNCYEGPVSCKLCPEVIHDRLHLRQHMDVNHSGRHCCSYCDLVLENRAAWREHQSTHPERFEYSCEECGEAFLTEVRLKVHKEAVHRDESYELTEGKAFKCHVCNKILTRYHNLKRHMRNHDKCSGIVTCAICSEWLTDKLHLRQHMDECHPETHQCSFCHKVFANKKVCRAHEQAHPERFNHACDSCNKTFLTEARLERHRTIVHRDPYCKHCSKMITDPLKLWSHERRHDKYKQQFPCTVCTKVFKTPSGLKYHMSAHTGQYAVYCDVCGKGMHSEVVLAEHMATHTKEVRFICDLCGRKFSSNSTYRMHRLWHDNPMPYQCNICHKKFKHTSILAVHKRRAHTGERPYKCPYCALTFMVSSTLNKHKILHTKDFPYRCEPCDKGFTTRAKIARHMAKVHDDPTMLNSRAKECEYKMVLRPSELPQEPKVKCIEQPQSLDDPAKLGVLTERKENRDTLEEVITIESDPIIFNIDLF